MKDAQKKRKATDDTKESADAAAPTKKKSTSSVASTSNDGDDADAFKPLSLKDIHDRMAELAKQVPEIPADGFVIEGAKPNASTGVIGEPPNNLDKVLIKQWASQLQVVLEELGLLLCCVSTACYRWGTDRSGAADQNLSLLNDELNSTQDQIASRVTPRLRNVLTPVVDLVVEKTITTKMKQSEYNGGYGDAAAETTQIGAKAVKHDAKAATQTGLKAVTYDGEDMLEVKQNIFTRKLEDPDFVHLCYEILARNAPMMRIVVLTNFSKMLRCIKDYLSAQNNDTQHHREFAY